MLMKDDLIRADLVYVGFGSSKNLLDVPYVSKAADNLRISSHC